MKKVMSFVSCALFVAAMTVSCGNNNTEATDSVIDSTAVEGMAEEPVAVEATAENDADADAAMLAAAQKCGQEICDCANGDAASIEKCMKSVIAASYGAYQNNEKFTSAVKAAIGDCAKEKAKAAAKEAVNKEVNKAANKAADALSKQFGK